MIERFPSFRSAAVPGRVSVIMPCFNVEPYLGQAVDSALDQTYGDVEIVLADDGSSDGTATCIAAYADDPRVVVARSPGGLGPSALRNLCIERSTGEFIAFLDADDSWEPRKITLQAERLRRHPRAGLSHTYLMMTDRDGRPLRRLSEDSHLFQGDCFFLMLRSNGVSTSSVMTRRTVFEAVGLFDERFRFRGDWEMWTRIAQHYELEFIGEVLGTYRLHETNVSHDLERVRDRAFAVVEKFATEYGLTEAQVKRYVDPTRTMTHRDYGLMALVQRNYPFARNDLWHVVRRAPLDWRAWLGLLKCYVYPIVR